MFGQDLLQFYGTKVLINKFGVFGGQLSRRSVSMAVRLQRSVGPWLVCGGQLSCTV